MIGGGIRKPWVRTGYTWTPRTMLWTILRPVQNPDTSWDLIETEMDSVTFCREYKWVIQ